MADESPLGVYEHAKEAAGYLQVGLPGALKSPVIGIICGSGLGGLVSCLQVEPQYDVDYARIPHFPRATGANLARWNAAAAAWLINGICWRSDGPCGKTDFRIVGLMSNSSGVNEGQATVSHIGSTVVHYKLLICLSYSASTKVTQSIESHSQFE